MFCPPTNLKDTTSDNENETNWTSTSSIDWEFVGPVFTGETGYLYAARWNSPIYNLRADLLYSSGFSVQGIPVFQKDARLRLSLQGANGSTFDGRNLKVIGTEFIQIADPSLRSNVTTGATPSPNLIPLQTTDVTSNFFPSGALPGVGNVLAGFAPPGTDLGGGDGYPVRYWRVSLEMTYLVPSPLPLPFPAPLPESLLLTAGMY